MLTDYFGEILNSLADGIVIVDADGLILYSNLEAERIFGYAPGTLAGRQVETLVPTGLGGRHIELRHTYVSNGPTVRPMGNCTNLNALRTDGTIVRVDIKLAPVSLPHTKIVVASIRRRGDA